MYKATRLYHVFELGQSESNVSPLNFLGVIHNSGAAQIEAIQIDSAACFCRMEVVVFVQ